MRARQIVLVLAAALVLAPASAGAATVTTVHTSSTGPHDEVYDDQTITFRAAPGERNVVTVSTVAGTSPSYPAFVIADTGGAPLIAGEGCAAQADGSVRCAPKGGTSFSFTADLGDGDDRVTVLEPEVRYGGSFRLDVGPGADVLDAIATRTGRQHGDRRHRRDRRHRADQRGGDQLGDGLAQRAPASRRPG